MTVSGGVAAFPEHAATQDELVRLASGALRQARAAGGGRIMAWSGRPAHRRPSGATSSARCARSSRPAGTRPRASRQRVRRPHRRCAGAGRPIASTGVRLAAYLYDATAPGGDARQRARIAARVAANALDDEAAGWLLARAAPVAEAPLETRVMAVAEAFVAAGGQRLGRRRRPRAGRSCGRGRRRARRSCVRALERLLAGGGPHCA